LRHFDASADAAWEAARKRPGKRPHRDRPDLLDRVASASTTRAIGGHTALPI
jgi:hypothetical protein